MLRLAVLLWTLIATALAGAFILTVVSTPALVDQSMRLIPIAVGAGALLAVPVAAFVARTILRSPRAA